MITLVLTLISLILVYFLINNPLRPKKFPPGPRWLPLVGCSPQFRRLTRELGYQHLAILRLCQIYNSPVIGLKLGNQLVVAVTGHEATRHVLTREEFEGRPDNFFIRLRSMGTQKGITCTDGVHWHEQRSFTVRHLKSLGFGKRTMETLILEQATEMLERFSKKTGQPIHPDLSPSVMSVLWALIAGNQFSEEDPTLAKLLDLMHRRTKAFDLFGGILNQFPWLRYIAPDATGYTLLKTVNSELYTFFMESILSHRKTFSKEDTRDLIDAYLREMEFRKLESNSTFTDDQLVMVCLDMFVAGSTTTSNTLGFALLHLSRYPALQTKIQQELEEQLGSEQIPTLADQVRLPYLCATILEVLRVYCVVPVGGPRRTLRDTDIMGYSIPKDTTILLNLWSVHQDPEHWENPEEFRPERFIDKDGKCKADDWLMTFGLGRRRCLGEVLARGCIFLFIASLLQRFSIRSIDSSPPGAPIPGITLSPPPYEIILVPR